MPETRPLRLSLRWKLTLGNVLVPMLTLVLATIFAIHAINTFVFRQAQNKIINDLHSAREIYNTNLRCLREKIRAAAVSHSLITALQQNDRPGLLREMQNICQREQLSLLTLTDHQGRVVLRAANPAASGDRPDLPLLGAALIGNPAAATEILPATTLSRENPHLEHLFRIKLISTPKAHPSAKTHLDEAMAMLAAWPLRDPTGNLLGVLLGGQLLNRNNQLVDRIKGVVFSDPAFLGRDIGTATIFQGDVRIATNVHDDSGNRAIGTRVSAEVYQKVLVNGQKWTDRAFVVNNWYISAYEPIRDSRDRVIGILYVGMLEKPFLAFRNRVCVTLITILASGILCTFLVVYFFARVFTRRLSSIQDHLRAVAAGNLNQRLQITGNDELNQLADGFNAMTEALRQRDASIEQMHRELENKVIQRTSELEARNRELLETKQHLLEMMSDKKAINFRLEESLQNLRQAQQQLIRSGKLAALGSLVAGVAHEINNPVNVIAGNLEILALDEEISRRYRTEFELINQQAGRIKKIIGNMLGFARVRPGSLRKFVIDQTIRELLSPLKKQLEQQGIELETRLQAETPIHSDEEGISQIIMNLLANSIQAMPTAGGRITISTRAEDGRIAVVISDTGCGMTAQQVENMFNPFYSTKSNGTGLGLAISYELLRSLGGDVEVASEPGRGTTVILFLPVNHPFPFAAPV
jgi:two-component system NtrC family sensor kinase